MIEADNVGHEPGSVACNPGSPTGQGGGRMRCTTPSSAPRAAARSRGTATVLLTSAEARALAALNQLGDTHDALARAAAARDRSFGHEAGTRSALAVARLLQGKVDGRPDAIRYDMPSSPTGL